MAILLKGKPVESIKYNYECLLENFFDNGIIPTLEIIRVGNNKDSIAYENSIVKHCEPDIKVNKTILSEQCSQKELIRTIKRLNKDSNVHGILLLRPLPLSLDEEEACNRIVPTKDVDGVSLSSLSELFVNSEQNVGFSPCTAEACVKILQYYEKEILQKEHIVVIGRSLTVGKPLSIMLQNQNATVTMCHSRTSHDLLKKLCKEADVIIAAAGHKNLITADMVNEHQTIIDVGINWDEEKQKIVGDVDFEEVEPIVHAITPVPGGVGVVTTNVLVNHIIKATEKVEKEKQWSVRSY